MKLNKLSFLQELQILTISDIHPEEAIINIMRCCQSI